MNKYQVRRWGAGALLAAAVLGAFGLLGQHSVVAVDGDQLGPDSSESRADYLSRAAASVASAEATAYAMVSFNFPVSPEQAAAAVAPAPRVSSIIVGAANPVAIPEPVAGSSREEVFRTAIERINYGLAGVGSGQAPEKLTGLIVYAGGEQLRAIAAADAVVAVEVAPSDAAWGSFGVRPLAAASSQS